MKIYYYGNTPKISNFKILDETNEFFWKNKQVNDAFNYGFDILWEYDDVKFRNDTTENADMFIAYEKFTIFSCKFNLKLKTQTDTNVLILEHPLNHLNKFMPKVIPSLIQTSWWHNEIEIYFYNDKHNNDHDYHYHILKNQPIAQVIPVLSNKEITFEKQELNTLKDTYELSYNDHLRGKLRIKPRMIKK